MRTTATLVAGRAGGVRAAINTRTGVAIARRTRSTRGMWDRVRGLLGLPALAEGEGLLIAPCNGIHTFGMRYAIDAVFLDRAGCVLRVARALRPLRCIPLVWRAHAVLELATGAIDRSGTVVGDTIAFAAIEDAA